MTHIQFSFQLFIFYSTVDKCYTVTGLKCSLIHITIVNVQTLYLHITTVLSTKIPYLHITLVNVQIPYLHITTVNIQILYLYIATLLFLASIASYAQLRKLPNDGNEWVMDTQTKGCNYIWLALSPTWLCNQQDNDKTDITEWEYT